MPTPLKISQADTRAWLNRHSPAVKIAGQLFYAGDILATMAPAKMAEVTEAATRWRCDTCNEVHLTFDCAEECCEPAPADHEDHVHDDHDHEEQ